MDSSNDRCPPLPDCSQGGRQHRGRLLGVAICAIVAALQTWAGCYVFGLLTEAEISIIAYAVATASAASLSTVVVAMLVQGSEP